jgi:hypothetical protein
MHAESLFGTNNDVANRASVAASPTDRLELVGVGLHADRKIIDKIVNGLRFLT